MTHLILASASAGRKHVLKQLRIPFEILPTDIDEDMIVGKTPLASIQKRAWVKAETAQKRNKKSDKSTLIISADTEVIFDNQLIGKPQNHEDAVRIFTMLSGHSHTVITALCVLRIEQEKILQKWETYDMSFVTFRKLSLSSIRRYLSTTKYTRYTAGYAIVASAQDFITKVEGSVSNVIGLPLEKLIPILQQNRLLFP